MRKSGKTIFSFLIALLALISCNNSKTLISSFDAREKLKADDIVNMNHMYVKNGRIFNLTDSTILLSCPATWYSSDNNLIYIVSKESGEVLKVLGKGGRGPRELMAVNNYSRRGNEILYYDAISRKMLRYKPGVDSTIIESLRFKGKFNLRTLFLLNDNKFLSYGAFDKHMYCYGDISTGESYYYLEFPLLPGIPKDKQDKYYRARSYAFQGGMLKHPSLSKFAYYSGGAEYLQLIDVTDERVNETMSLSLSPPGGKVDFSRDGLPSWGSFRNSLAYFLGGDTSEKYIYLLYSGKPFSNENNQKSKYIMIFDWNGNKIKIIELDHEVYSITVGQKDKEIIAFTVNDVTLKDEILRYKL